MSNLYNTTRVGVYTTKVHIKEADMFIYIRKALLGTHKQIQVSIQDLALGLIRIALLHYRIISPLIHTIIQIRKYMITRVQIRIQIDFIQ